MNKIVNKKIRSKFTTVAAAAVILFPFASAQSADRHASRDRFTVYADVISAEPIYREVVLREPVKECWTEQERYVVQEGQTYRQNGSTRRSSNGGDALVGGVIGGVIGNQLGRNGGRGARAGATVAGAIIGSVIANEAGGHSSSPRRHRRNNHQSTRHAPAHETVYGVRPVERCKTVVNNRYEQRIEGYKVVYEHRGRRFQTRTRKDPGSTIQLRVHVEPIATQ